MRDEPQNRLEGEEQNRLGKEPWRPRRGTRDEFQYRSGVDDQGRLGEAPWRPTGGARDESSYRLKGVVGNAGVQHYVGPKESEDEVRHMGDVKVVRSLAVAVA